MSRETERDELADAIDAFAWFDRDELTERGDSPALDRI